MPQNKKHESGNVFMFILLGIVLFGALAFTVARGFRSDTTSSISARQAELAASDILNYAQQAARAVDRLRRKGCSEQEISWQNDYALGTSSPGPTWFNNASAPVDNSCHIFHPDGGNLQYRTFPDDIFINCGEMGASPAATCNLWRTHPMIDDNINFVEDTTRVDPAFKLMFLKREVCEVISNKLHNFSGTYETNSSGFHGNRGQMDLGAVDSDVSSAAHLDGGSGCGISGPDPGSGNGNFGFVFWKVLIAR